jgi:cell division inhibitor SepF
MAFRDTWRRALEYFGLVEGDYIEEGEYTDEHEITGPDRVLENEPPRRETRDTGQVSAIRTGAGRDRRDDIDDIFADDEPPRRRLEPVEEVDRPSRGGGRSRGNGGAAGEIHMVTPRSFNDAQQVGDEFKRQKAVIINLQTSDRELSKRLIDFASGLTYALGGGMQKIADKVFLLSPANVEVSAEEKARILEGGFFNQS